MNDLIEAASDLTIRKAEVEDATALASLLRSIGWFTRMESEPESETITTIVRHLEQCCGSGSHSVYVALTGDDNLVGYISAHWLPYLILSGTEGFVSELFVSEAARGQRIGTRLLETVETEAHERGCSRLHLINFRDRDSYKRGFYTKMGWEERPDGASFVRKIGQ